MKQVFETDWLASQPVFYNELTGKVSSNINDVIDFSNFEFHPEGFNNYLDFGYSVFEQTPVKHVKFLRHSSHLTVLENGKLEIEYLDDPVEQWVGKVSHEDDVLHMLYTSVRGWENTVEGEIIIPTSGGYDSRLLNLLIEDKSRIRSFTYGLSEEQTESFEVVNARKVSEILGIKWEQISLGDFHLYFDVWDSLFGVSTHAHGMYHIEFYTKLLPKVNGQNAFLSGIIGDAWAGSVNIPSISSTSDLSILGYTHGLNADSAMSMFNFRRNMLLSAYQLDKSEQLMLPLFRVVEAMRFKIILLSYLIRVPTHFGFKPWSPFLDSKIALSMLTLLPERRKSRLWQKEFFRNHGLDIESMNLQTSGQNNLNHQAMRRIPVKPLDINLLREVVQPSYVEWINTHVSQQGAFWDGFWNLQRVPKIGGLLRQFGIREQRLKAYCAYLTLKPIENLLIKRNELSRQTLSCL